MTADALPRVRVAAHAKVNLALRILAREEGGHHQLETDFHRLALADEVTVSLTHGDGIAFTSDATFDIPPAQNLAVRAAVAYVQAAAWPHRGIAIHVAKRIPMGGGLGGGSADAGAVLRGLDALNPAPLGEATLVRIATPLGADVPFLATTAPRVLAWGRGERMLALPPLADVTVHLACFDAGVHTGHAYGWLADARAAAPASVSGALHDAGALSQLRAVRGIASNAFEPVVGARRTGSRTATRWCC
ncbi:MAG: hypothetical protein MUF21_05005 [Gemmatimonadaceae bacterium]|nr:hypothetical protein [Gemmatimonadaceae bacterium]